MPSWLVWVVVAVGLGIGEILTPGLFFLGPVALAAGAAAIVAALGRGVWLSSSCSRLCSIASLALLRPVARSHLRMPAAMRTGTAALVGRARSSCERVDANGGRVKHRRRGLEGAVAR